MAHFDLSNLALSAVCPGNEILYDDKGMPSVMVKLAPQTYKQLGMGNSEEIHSSFYVNNKLIKALWLSKYSNIIKNGRAYSLPNQDPWANITFDDALAACTAKGEGWHLMTQMERGLLINWCENNGYIPIGNNQYGKHTSESSYKAIPSATVDGQTSRTATGTGPLTWNHDNTPSGIADLAGNVRNWSGGIRLVYGELQILANNDGADGLISQGITSSEWKAIKASDGSLIQPNGSGTTSGSVKMDWISNKIVYSANMTNQAVESRYCNFGVIEADETLGEKAKLLLISLGFLPKDPNVLCKDHRCYFNNGEAERSFCCGGYYNLTTNGLATFHGYYPRSHVSATIGFRSAFVEL